MGVRDEDLKKLFAFAKGLSIKIHIIKHKKGDWAGADWDFTDPKKPKIYLSRWPHQTKTALILLLIHELGHHLDWIHQNKIISKLEREASTAETARKKTDPILSKKFRQSIYASELRGIGYMDIIAKEAQIELPIWKVQACQALDHWIYRHYLRTGDVPTTRIQKAKQQELRKRYYEDK